MELRALAVDPRGALSPVAQALEAGGAPPAAFCQPPEAVPWAHVKTQAVCVAGWDLPATLPESMRGAHACFCRPPPAGCDGASSRNASCRGRRGSVARDSVVIMRRLCEMGG